MELEKKVESLERQLKKQGRFLKIISCLLILIFGTAFVQWILSRKGWLDLQGRTLLVRSSFESNVVFSAALLPYRLDLESRTLGLSNAPSFEHRSHLGLGKASHAASMRHPVD